MNTTTPLSKCCSAPMAIRSGGGGTHYFLCSKCKEPCDAIGDGPSAPSPAAQPTDEAKLREAILDAVGAPCFEESLGCYLPYTLETLTDRILTALAPHLAQREPGDSELRKWQACAERLARAVESALGNDLSVKTEWKLSGALDEFAAIKSAQRGEGKP